MRRSAFGPGVHISYDDGTVKCPRCRTKHYDKNDKLYKRLEKNKRGYTKHRCQCGYTYGVTICMIDGLTQFPLFSPAGKRRREKRYGRVAIFRHPKINTARQIHKALKPCWVKLPELP